MNVLEILGTVVLVKATVAVILSALVFIASKKDAVRRRWTAGALSSTDDHLHTWPPDRLKVVRSFLMSRIVQEDLSAAELVDLAFGLRRVEEALTGLGKGHREIGTARPRRAMTEPDLDAS